MWNKSPRAVCRPGLVLHLVPYTCTSFFCIVSLTSLETRTLMHHSRAGSEKGHGRHVRKVTTNCDPVLPLAGRCTILGRPAGSGTKGMCTPVFSFGTGSQQGTRVAPGGLQGVRGRLPRYHARCPQLTAGRQLRAKLGGLPPSLPPNAPSIDLAHPHPRTLRPTYAEKYCICWRPSVSLGCFPWLQQCPRLVGRSRFGAVSGLVATSRRQWREA